MKAISVVCQEPISGTCHEGEANSSPYQNSSATGERENPSFRCARPDTLDPALLRSGRLDRKIELPHPNEETRGGFRVRGVTWGARNGWVGGSHGWWVGG